MTRQEAIDFINDHDIESLRYGDLGYVTSKEDAIEDIENMSDEAWNDGRIYAVED